MGLRLRIIFAWIAAFGCGPTGPIYNVAVTAYLGADGASLNPTARIHVYTELEGTRDLLRTEVAHKIEYLLTTRGYGIAPAEKSDHIVFFAYGMGSHAETVTEYVPDPNSAGTSSAGSAQVKAFVDAFKKSSKTTPQQALRKVNDRFLKVVVIDANKLRLTGEMETVWQCETLSSGPSADLRKALHYMLIPTFANFGTDTGEAVAYAVSGNDHAVRELRFVHDRRFSGSSFRSAAGIEATWDILPKQYLKEDNSIRDVIVERDRVHIYRLELPHLSTVWMDLACTLPVI